MHITDKLKDVDNTVLRLVAKQDEDARNELFRRQLNMRVAIHFATKEAALQARTRALRQAMTNSGGKSTGTENR